MSLPGFVKFEQLEKNCGIVNTATNGMSKDNELKHGVAKIFRQISPFATQFFMIFMIGRNLKSINMVLILFNMLFKQLESVSSLFQNNFNVDINEYRYTENRQIIKLTTFLAKIGISCLICFIVYKTFSPLMINDSSLVHIPYIVKSKHL
eukprot:TRINITY_DN12215_c0_g1_i1.p1 TRINITY_DN12215_c0_g1~~TRINITY_DN12215_c0_g1_i1.p1  ORF type:complete len:150 (-),score=25.27 TRINITY_DN12215_c0_g1_i1:16-465(-)